MKGEGWGERSRKKKILSTESEKYLQALVFFHKEISEKAPEEVLSQRLQIKKAANEDTWAKNAAKCKCMACQGGLSPDCNLLQRRRCTHKDSPQWHHVQLTLSQNILYLIIIPDYCSLEYLNVTNCLITLRNLKFSSTKLFFISNFRSWLSTFTSITSIFRELVQRKTSIFCIKNNNPCCFHYRWNWLIEYILIYD